MPPRSAGTVWMPNLPKATTVATRQPAAQRHRRRRRRRDGRDRGGGDPDALAGRRSPTTAPPACFSGSLGGNQALTRSAEAEYYLPLPLGSPLNYFGGDQTKTGTPDTITITVDWPIPYNSTPGRRRARSAATSAPPAPRASGGGPAPPPTAPRLQRQHAVPVDGAPPPRPRRPPTTQSPPTSPCNRLQAPDLEPRPVERRGARALPHLHARPTGSRRGTGNRQCIWAVPGTEPPDAATRAPQNAPCNVTGEPARGQLEARCSASRCTCRWPCLRRPLCAWLADDHDHDHAPQPHPGGPESRASGRRSRDPAP